MRHPNAVDVHNSLPKRFPVPYALLQEKASIGEYLYILTCYKKIKMAYNVFYFFLFNKIK